MAPTLPPPLPPAPAYFSSKLPILLSGTFWWAVLGLALFLVLLYLAWNYPYPSDPTVSGVDYLLSCFQAPCSLFAGLIWIASLVILYLLSPVYLIVGICATLIMTAQMLIVANCRESVIIEERSFPSKLSLEDVTEETTDSTEPESESVEDFESESPFNVTIEPNAPILSHLSPPKPKLYPDLRQHAHNPNFHTFDPTLD